MRLREAKFIDVLVVSVCEGDGTANSPCRVVKYYMIEGDDGEMDLLFKKDSIEIKGGDEQD